MNESAADNFGILISYLIPGATVLLGLSLYSPVIASWFAATPPNAPTIGGFLYLTVASLAAGMTVSAVRWAVIDTLHARTGLPMPLFDFSKLGTNVDAFNLLIEIHYRHYQFHANMVVAIVIAYACYRGHIGLFGPAGWLDTAMSALGMIFFITSRDNLQKYYSRASRLLGTEAAASQ